VAEPEKFTGNVLNFVNAPNDTNGPRGHSIINAGPCGQLPCLLAHVCPVLSRLCTGSSLEIYLDLLRSELQAMTGSMERFNCDVLQQCKSGYEIRKQNVAAGCRAPGFRGARLEAGDLVALGGPFRSLRGVLSGFNRAARCSMIGRLGD
jgi:hypothetical protein